MKAIHNDSDMNLSFSQVVVNIIKSKNESNSQLGASESRKATGCCKYH
ncbi:Uncharacterised protein [Sphingobacterium spiritivorum]|nr:Uncharacterised protein [Sphingobacterium spiritivorum]